MDGVVATNTTLSRDAVQGLAHADEAGACPARRCAGQQPGHCAVARPWAKLSIVGVAASCSPDAVEKSRPGPDVVQIYTGLIYQGPSSGKRCGQGNKELARITAVRPLGPCPRRA